MLIVILQQKQTTIYIMENRSQYVQQKMVELHQHLQECKSIIQGLDVLNTTMLLEQKIDKTPTMERFHALKNLEKNRKSIQEILEKTDAYVSFCQKQSFFTIDL